MSMVLKLVLLNITMIAATFVLAYLPMFGIKPSFFGILTLGMAFFIVGFINFNNFKRGIKKNHNITMMIAWFFIGSGIFIIGILSIVDELNKLSK